MPMQRGRLKAVIKITKEWLSAVKLRKQKHHVVPHVSQYARGKWEKCQNVPKLISALGGFHVFANSYSGFVQNYAELVAVMQDKLVGPRNQAKTGSKALVARKEKMYKAFEPLGPRGRY